MDEHHLRVIPSLPGIACVVDVAGKGVELVFWIAPTVDPRVEPLQHRRKIDRLHVTATKFGTAHLVDVANVMEERDGNFERVASDDDVNHVGVEGGMPSSDVWVLITRPCRADGAGHRLLGDRRYLVPYFDLVPSGTSRRFLSPAGCWPAGDESKTTPPAMLAEIGGTRHEPRTCWQRRWWRS